MFTAGWFAGLLVFWVGVTGAMQYVLHVHWVLQGQKTYFHAHRDVNDRVPYFLKNKGEAAKATPLM